LTINSYQFYKNASDDQNWHVNYLGTLEIKFLDNVNPFVSQDILLYAFAFSNFEFNPTDSSEPYWHNDKWTSSISTEVGFISYYKANTGYPYIMEPISEINSIRTTYGSGTYGVYLNFKIV
jgi:hypothetical protein